jgi:hypothetical protein
MYTNLAESFKDGHSSKGVVLPMLMLIMMMRTFWNKWYVYLK